MKKVFRLVFLMVAFGAGPAFAACPLSATASCASQTSNPLQYCIECRNNENGHNVTAKKCRRVSIDTPDDATLEQQARAALCEGRAPQPIMPSMRAPSIPSASGRLPNPLTSPLAD